MCQEVEPKTLAARIFRKEVLIAGLVFVLTGVFESLEREEMAEIVKNLGGKVTTSLSKNTKYLVVGEAATTYMTEHLT